MAKHKTLSPFEDRLLDDLLAFQRTLPAPETPTPLKKRRRLRLRVAFVVLAVAALATGVAVLEQGSGKPLGKGAPLTARYVTRQLLAALSRPSDLILYEQTRASGLSRHIRESWYDLSTRRVRTLSYLEGVLFIESVDSYTGRTVHTEIADYASKSVVTLSYRIAHAIPNAVGDQGQGIREDISKGVFRIVGTGTIDGQPVIHLTGRFVGSETLYGNPTLRAKFPGTTETVDLWVNSTTYFPIRWENSGSAGNGLTEHTTTEYDWLPPTTKNLANLNFVAPPGFRHETLPKGTRGVTCGSQGCSPSGP